MTGQVLVQYWVDYEADLADLEREFKSYSRDTAGRTSWFVEHPYLTLAEHARVAGVAMTTINKWKLVSGLTKRHPRCRTPRSIVSPDIAIIDVPPDWSTKEWLETKLRVHSISALARAVGRSRIRLYQLLTKFKIDSKALRVRATKARAHPCCNRDWLFEHYVRRGLNEKNCAETAGVSRQTLHKWLVRHKIPVVATRSPIGSRHNRESSGRKDTISS